MPKSADFMPNVASDLVTTIASGQTTSGEIALGGTVPAGVFLPAAFTGTALSFQASPVSGGTYGALQSAGTTSSLACAAGVYVGVDRNVFSGVRFLKIVSNASEAAQRTLTLATRPA
jgi:hypothetical protein